jgi:hypothetical protein
VIGRNGWPDGQYLALLPGHHLLPAASARNPGQRIDAGKTIYRVGANPLTRALFRHV